MAVWSIPLLWLMSMSVRYNEDILTVFEIIPSRISFRGYIEFFSEPQWYGALINSLSYTTMNMVLSVAVALPAAYAFSRFTFSGDKHLFFWLLTNRMAPAAVFLLPFFQMYQSLGLFDTTYAVALAHMLFNVPLAVWILEGFMSGVPRQLDEMAEIDGYSFPRFFLTVFVPMIRAGIGVTAFFAFMFSWVELLIAKTLTGPQAMPLAVQMSTTSTAAGLDWALLSAAGVIAIIPGVIVIWFVRNYIAKGFALGRV
ncbi:carbohydrate ABC transporter permease [Pontimonas sp.]|uniref:carbohydrate ABC transporter permease n=1 Tax=Pontimonas sp. TaxID=2304492 RepID=UPI0037C9E53B